MSEAELWQGHPPTTSAAQIEPGKVYLITYKVPALRSTSSCG